MFLHCLRVTIHVSIPRSLRTKNDILVFTHPTILYLYHKHTMFINRFFFVDKQQKVTRVKSCCFTPQSSHLPSATHSHTNSLLKYWYVKKVFTSMSTKKRDKNIYFDSLLWQKIVFINLIPAATYSKLVYYGSLACLFRYCISAILRLTLFFWEF